GKYSDDTTAPLTDQATWSSSDPAVATVSNAAGQHGVATGLAVGSATITATVGGIAGTASLNVTAAQLVSIEVTPAAPSLAAGTSVQLTATGTFSDASKKDLSSSATWSSSASQFATVGSSGMVSAVAQGSAVVTAAVGAISGSTTATVTAAVLTSIQVTPQNPTIAKGTQQQFVATGVFSNATTQDLSSQVTWASSAPAIATVSTAGLADAAAVGSSTISASKGGVTGSTLLTVSNAVLVSVQVTPASPSIAKGTTEQFAATGVYSDASTQDLT